MKEEYFIDTKRVVAVLPGPIQGSQILLEGGHTVTTDRKPREVMRTLKLETKEQR